MPSIGDSLALEDLRKVVFRSCRATPDSLPLKLCSHDITGRSYSAENGETDTFSERFMLS